MPPPEVPLPAHTIQRRVVIEKRLADQRARAAAAPKTEIQPAATRRLTSQTIVQSTAQKVTPICNTCSLPGHKTDDCFLTNGKRLAEYLACNPRSAHKWNRKIWEYQNPWCTVCNEYRHPKTQCFLTNQRLRERYVNANPHTYAYWQRKVWEYEWRKDYGPPGL